MYGYFRAQRCRIVAPHYWGEEILMMSVKLFSTCFGLTYLVAKTGMLVYGSFTCGSLQLVVDISVYVRTNLDMHASHKTFVLQSICESIERGLISETNADLRVALRSHMTCRSRQEDLKSVLPPIFIGNLRSVVGYFLQKCFSFYGSNQSNGSNNDWEADRPDVARLSTTSCRYCLSLCFPDCATIREMTTKDCPSYVARTTVPKRV